MSHRLETERKDREKQEGPIAFCATFHYALKHLKVHDLYNDYKASTPRLPWSTYEHILEASPFKQEINLCGRIR
jgi:hypothetical protein